MSVSDGIFYLAYGGKKNNGIYELDINQHEIYLLRYEPKKIRERLDWRDVPEDIVTWYCKLQEMVNITSKEIKL